MKIGLNRCNYSSYSSPFNTNFPLVATWQLRLNIDVFKSFELKDASENYDPFIIGQYTK